MQLIVRFFCAPEVGLDYISCLEVTSPAMMSCNFGTDASLICLPVTTEGVRPQYAMGQVAAESCTHVCAAVVLLETTHAPSFHRRKTSQGEVVENGNKTTTAR